MRLGRSSTTLATLVGVLLADAAPAHAQRADPLASMNREIAVAETALQNGERQVAESHFRSALLEGWMLTGAIAATDGKLADARDAFARAAAATASSGAAEHARATIALQLGDADEALRILNRLAGLEPRNTAIRRLLAQAYVAGGRPEAAVQELEEAHTQVPDDLETSFALASGYARLKKLDAAGALFDQIAAKRPLPQTYVLIGRAYLDAGVYDRAVAAMRRALALDPRVRRAHYSIGMAAVMNEGIARLDEAIAEFQRERTVSPDDPLNNLRLGMALVEARREREALPPLERVVQLPHPPAGAVEYLGRAQLGAGRTADAVATLQRALAAAAVSKADAGRIGHLHYLVAMALRAAGRPADADAHFAEAQRASAARADTDRERLARYMKEGEAPADTAVPPAPLEAPALEGVTAAARAALAPQIAGTLARTCFNLGILQAQAARFTRAAAFFDQAAALDPSLPRVQYSLGVAYFSAGEYGKAIAPLQHAIDAEPQNMEARRMLGMAAFNTAQYERAAELLGQDPQRGSDPSLGYTYGLALVRSDRVEEAKRVFASLIAAHGDSPELNVVLGQAHAQQGDFDAAIAVLRAALDKKPDVAEANATLGMIYLKQGHLAEAAAALRAELAAHAADVTTRYTLATVLDLQGQVDEALAQLRTVLGARPDYADARYLHGKILLARGDADGAIAQLEIAARLAPEDANVHYQLAQAYQKTGKTALADEHFQTYQRLKDRRRKDGR